MPDAAIEVEDLTKRYEPAGVQALAGVSFAVDEGEVFAFLGRNGAGKSTTVRILTTLIRPTSGSARVGGFDVIARPSSVRRVLGAALQEAALDELMTGREHLVLAGRLAGLSKAAARPRAAELLEMFGLAGAGDRIAAGYSGGMRRRLDVAMAMVRRPRVLFLDEPTTGLDPQGRRALWGLVRAMRDEGCAVFLTTQYMAEADELSDRVAVVHDGRIAATGTTEQLKARWGTTTIRLRVAPDSVERVRAIVVRGDVRYTDDGWVVITMSGGSAGVPAAVPALVAKLHNEGIDMESLAILPPTLEDVFVNLTGTGIETSSGSGTGPSDSVTAVRRGVGLPLAGGRR